MGSLLEVGPDGRLLRLPPWPQHRACTEAREGAAVAPRSVPEITGVERALSNFPGFVRPCPVRSGRPIQERSYPVFRAHISAFFTVLVKAAKGAVRRPRRVRDGPGLCGTLIALRSPLPACPPVHLPALRGAPARGR